MRWQSVTAHKNQDKYVILYAYEDEREKKVSMDFDFDVDLVVTADCTENVLQKTDSKSITLPESKAGAVFLRKKC